MDWNLLLPAPGHMTPDDLQPALFRTDPPLPDMVPGKIRIQHAGGELTGSLVPYHRPQDQLFGARIDILGQVVCGLGTVIGLKLSEALLRQIERTDNAAVPYALKFDQDLSALFPRPSPIAA